ncbi:MAG: acylphosphatase [Methanospirillum sp.]|uniref:acylphosphatase n=1 Tax=Methanospirillum sp. TaxID=45200 RepID=UPI002371E9CA|nr:acylphosphatase [Methanospirillum sp.]MDD1729664.1 acylphosphatase [Methanospirillum sp.]
MDPKRVRVVVEGRVQGVGYRMFTRDLAARYGLNGWVKNRDDGKVEAAIEGPEEDVNSMIEGLYARDSYIIRVDRVVIARETPTGETGFEIRR